MARLWLFLLAWSIHGLLFAQSDSLIVTKSDIALIEADSRGNLYIADIHGNVTKYSHDLGRKWLYSPEKKGHPKILNVQNPLRAFVFYDGLQQYHFLDRFMIASNQFKIDHIAAFSGLVTPSSDNKIWLIDFTDLSLKKYDQQFNRVEIERSFDLLLDPDTYEITNIHEYQGYLYIHDTDSGILVFDLMGNFLKKIKIPEEITIHFSNQYLYYTKLGELNFINLRDETKKTIALTKDVIESILTEKHIYLVTKKGIQRQYRPVF